MYMRYSSLKIISYTTKSGKCPFVEWVDELDFKVSARIQARLNRISCGNFGDMKSVGDGVNELRMTFGPGYRVYYAHYEEEIVLLLCGGDKNSQKNDIEKAKKYWSDYKRRRNEL